MTRETCELFTRAVMPTGRIPLGNGSGRAEEFAAMLSSICSEKLGASRNGRMERNFRVILIFRNFRPTSRGTPKISE